MSLRIVINHDEGLAGSTVQAALDGALAHAGQALLLVPTFAQALQFQKELSNGGEGRSLGIMVTTPNAWIAERWEVWGDGRHIVTAVERSALMHLAVRETPSFLASTQGTVDALCSLARAGLAWMPSGAADVPQGMQLTEGELEVCKVLNAYRAQLSERRLVESCEAASVLSKTLPAYQPMVLSGFSTIDHSVQELLLAAAQRVHVDVSLAYGAQDARPMIERLQNAASLCGVDVVVDAAPDIAADGEDEEELEQLVHALLQKQGTVEDVVPQGMVRLVEPEGPLAEGALVGAQIKSLFDEGMRDVVVVTPDVEGAWRDLTPRLRGLGIASSCTLRRNAATDNTVVAFFAFATTVARLAELGASWPEPIQGKSGMVPQLGDMSWWPPRPLIDFLMSSISQVDEKRVWELDARWRANRSLTPMAVLDHLQKESMTSRAVAQATASILRGRVGTAAFQLARALKEAGADADDDEALVALGCIQEVARTMGALGVSASPKTTTRALLPLRELVALLQAIVNKTRINERVTTSTADELPVVRICSRQEASTMPRRSCDALLVCGMTSTEWPLTPRDDASVALLEKLGLACEEPPLEVARRQLRGMVGSARRVVLLERVRHNHDAQPTYPAVMLSELLACYGKNAERLSVASCGEDRPDVLLTASGQGARPTACVPVVPAGKVSQAASDMVVVPREGEAALPEGKPSLSASQIESYLECPYKWFTLRRLGLGDNDATFSPMQMGSFAHRVLEVARRTLTQRAAQEAGLVEPDELLDLEGTDITYIPGSSISADNQELARYLVEEEFAYHLEHQRQKATMLAAQSLVPHSATEEYRLGALKADLLSAIDFEVGKFNGFEPRYFELRFGGSNPRAHHITYAGADFVGSIDRVDVDAHGRAIVVDYKHKSANGFAAEYDAFTDECPVSLEELVLPRRVQSLIYAQVVRRLYPDLKVVGAVYLSTMGSLRGAHEIAGVIDANAADQVMGAGLTDKRAQHLVAGGLGKISFDDVLDETERRIAEKIALLMQGNIEANPIDDKACQWCPVVTCERRRG